MLAAFPPTCRKKTLVCWVYHRPLTLLLIDRLTQNDDRSIAIHKDFNPFAQQQGPNVIPQFAFNLMSMAFRICNIISYPNLHSSVR